MPQLKMQFQTKNTNSLANLMQIQSSQSQNLVIPPRLVTTRSSRGTASLSGLVGPIQNLSTGCKSCGR